MPDLKDIFVMPKDDLAKLKRPSDFIITPDTMGADARLSIYRKPIPGHLYVAGCDTALGLEGRDYDALVMLDKNTWPVQQVAELEGRWGTDSFDRLVYVLLRYYFNAFLVAEKQVGLPLLRSLLNTFKYGYLYYNRDEVSKGRRRTDALGHHKIAGDPLIHVMRTAVKDKQVIPRSERWLGQLGEYQFRPKGRVKEKTEEMRDGDLIMGAPSGGFDDLVNAGAYAWKGINEVHLFADDRPPIEAGKAGDVLGMLKALERERPKKKSPFARSGDQ